MDGCGGDRLICRLSGRSDIRRERQRLPNPQTFNLRSFFFSSPLLTGSILIGFLFPIRAGINLPQKGRPGVSHFIVNKGHETHRLKKKEKKLIAPVAVAGGFPEAAAAAAAPIRRAAFICPFHSADGKTLQNVIKSL